MRAVDPDMPIPLILESLRGNVGWKLLEERLQAVRDGYNRTLITMPAKTPPEELQRVIGIMEGLDRVLRDPHILEREWKSAHAAREKKIADQRRRAEDYAAFGIELENDD